MKKIYKHPAIEFVRLDMKSAIMLNTSYGIYNHSVDDGDEDDIQKTDDNKYIWGTQL